MLELEKIMLEASRDINDKVLQTVIEEDIIVPDVKPDVNKMLQVDGEVHIKEQNTNSDKINYKGIFEYNCLYISDDENKTINSIMGEMDFNDYIDNNDMDNDKMSVSCDLDYIEYTILNSRKIHLKAILNIRIRKDKVNVEEIVANLKNNQNFEITKKMIKMDKAENMPEEKIVIKDMMVMPSNKPSISNILKCNIKPNNMEYIVTNGKMNIKGNLHIVILYKNYDNDTSMEFYEYDVPVNENLLNDLDDSVMIANANAEVQDKYIEVSLDDDGEERVLNMEVMVKIKAKMIKPYEMEIINDIYSTNSDIDVNRKSMEYEKVYMKNKNKYTMKEYMKIDNEDNIMQIYNMDTYLKVEDMEISDNAMEVYGVIICKILYIVADDENPIKSFEKEIPFMQKIDAEGIKNNMSVDLSGDIEYTSYNMVSQNELEMRFVIIFDLMVKEKIETEFVVDMEEKEIMKDPKDASMIIYIARKGESMWDVAKKYKTTVKKIMDINGMEDENDLHVGQKIIII